MLLTAATPNPLVTHNLTHTETHSHTLVPTHLSGGFEIELGLGTNTPNNYLSLLRLVIHFLWIYSHMPLFFFPLFLSLSSSSSSSSSITHSHLPLLSPLTGDGIFPSGPQTKCDNTAIMLLPYGSRWLSRCPHCGYLELQVTLYVKLIKISCSVGLGLICAIVLCEEEEKIFLRIV